MRGDHTTSAFRPLRLRLVLSLAVALALAVAGAPLGQPTTLAADEWDYFAARDAILPPLPTEPSAAAVALIDLVYDEDFEVATFATWEVLRRAGLPLINLDGLAIALPDDNVLFDAAVPAEMVPNVTRSVRAGDFYTLEEADFLLVDSGIFPEPIPLDALATALGQWGKPSADPAAPIPPAESVFAGAAVRALGAKQGEVYSAALDSAPATLDPLQVALLFAHIASPAYKVTAPQARRTVLDEVLRVRVARAAETGGCIAALDAYDKTIGDTGGALLWETFKWALGNKELAEKFDNTKGRIDKASAILTTLIWLTGIRMNLVASPSGTHFRHQPGDASRNLTVTATVRFDYPLSANAAACLKLFANMDVFPEGPLPGFKVRWSIDQPQNRAAQGKLLRPVAGQAGEFTPTGGGGVDTDKSGQSKVILEPAVERQPEAGKLKTGKATVHASVDKDDFPFALKDALGLKDPFGFAADKIFDLVNSAIRRIGLPSQSVTLPVEYHSGADILVIEGETTLFALWYFLPIKVKLWTCDGLKGRWQGTTGVNADLNAFGDLANSILPKLSLPTFPEGTPSTVDENFQLDLSDGFDRAVVMGGFGMDVDVNTSQWNAGWKGRGFSNTSSGKVKLAGQVVGTATLTIEGQSLEPLAVFDGRSAVFDVVRYSPDDFENNASAMCPGGEGSDSYFP